MKAPLAGVTESDKTKELFYLEVIKKVILPHVKIKLKKKLLLSQIRYFT